MFYLCVPKRGKLALIAGPEGSGAAVTIHQDARIYATLLDGAESVTLAIAPGRKVYVHVARGAVTVNGTALAAGDAVKIEGHALLSERVRAKSTHPAQVDLGE